MQTSVRAFLDKLLGMEAFPHFGWVPPTQDFIPLMKHPAIAHEQTDKAVFHRDGHVEACYLACGSMPCVHIQQPGEPSQYRINAVYPEVAPKVFPRRFLPYYDNFHLKYGS